LLGVEIDADSINNKIVTLSRKVELGNCTIQPYCVSQGLIVAWGYNMPFFLVLQVHQQRKKDNRSQQEVEPLTKTQTILVAEDKALVRDMVVAALQNQGYNVLEAANGAEALQVAQQYTAGAIQLLVSDIVMPQMDGIELAKHFRGLFPDAKVLLITGYFDEPNIRQAVPDPSVALLLKPFMLEELVQKVREALTNNPLARAVTSTEARIRPTLSDRSSSGHHS
jgi:two-component system, cell cycle sensor histidine kinase and response regulator CckA